MSTKIALQEQFEREALPHFSRIYTAAFFLTQDETEAEDLVQEAYLAAFRFFDKFQPGTNCKAWLLSIVRHLFINRYHQKKRAPEMVGWEKIDEVYDSMIEQSTTLTPESLIFSKMMSGEIEKALAELPEEFRTAIVLVDIEDLSYEEAAQVMGCPMGTVRSRVSRGRRLLQVMLWDYALKKGLITGRETLVTNR